MNLQEVIHQELQRRMNKAVLSKYKSFGGSRDKAIDTLYQQVRREVLGVINHWHDLMTEGRKSERARVGPDSGE